MTVRYRAWIKTEKRMFFSDDILNIDYENKEIVTQQIYFKNGLPDDRDIYFYDFDEIELMQSTGLKTSLGIFLERLLSFGAMQSSICYGSRRKTASRT